MINFITENLTNSIIIFSLLILLTFFQKYYYKILFSIGKKSPEFVNKTINFIVRFGVILHEFSHVFFSFLAGHKIQEINLFSKNGGSVKFSHKNYIQSFGKGIFSFNYWIKLIFNQIGLFLTSIGPLIIGIILNYFFWNNLIGINISFENTKFTDIKNFENIKNFLLETSGIKIFLVSIYLILIPNFILSWQDISHFLISRQVSKIATFVGSIINILIFIIFLFIFSLSFDFFILFCLSFILSFLTTLILLLILEIFVKIKKIFLKKSN